MIDTFEVKHLYGRLTSPSNLLPLSRWMCDEGVTKSVIGRDERQILTLNEWLCKIKFLKKKNESNYEKLYLFIFMWINIKLKIFPIKMSEINLLNQNTVCSICCKFSNNWVLNRWVDHPGCSTKLTWPYRKVILNIQCNYSLILNYWSKHDISVVAVVGFCTVGSSADQLGLQN